MVRVERWDRVSTMSAGGATRKGINAGGGGSGDGYEVCEADGG
jgi:hypothetical protein